MELAKWGMRWMFEIGDESEVELAVLLGHMAVFIDTDELPSCEIVIQFSFEDLEESKHMFVFIRKDSREVCDQNPGHEVDVYLRSTFRTIAVIWQGELAVETALGDHHLKAVGSSVYTKSLRWLPVSLFADEPGVAVSMI